MWWGDRWTGVGVWRVRTFCLDGPVPTVVRPVLLVLFSPLLCTLALQLRLLLMWSVTSSCSRALRVWRRVAHSGLAGSDVVLRALAVWSQQTVCFAFRRLQALASASHLIGKVIAIWQSRFLHRALQQWGTYCERASTTTSTMAKFLSRLRHMEVYSAFTQIQRAAAHTAEALRMTRLFCPEVRLSRRAFLGWVEMRDMKVAMLRALQLWQNVLVAYGFRGWALTAAMRSKSAALYRGRQRFALFAAFQSFKSHCSTNADVLAIITSALTVWHKQARRMRTVVEQTGPPRWTVPSYLTPPGPRTQACMFALNRWMGKTRAQRVVLKAARLLLDSLDGTKLRTGFTRWMRLRHDVLLITNALMTMHNLSKR